MNKISFLLLISIILSGCAELSHLVTIGANDQQSSGLEPMTTGIAAVTEKATDKFLIPIDVDTAAARIKRYYQFSSLDEVKALRNNGTTSGGWKATAITDGAYAWEAMPGSYYKMGRDWDGGNGANDSLLIEIEKSDKGSRIYITYRSNKPSHVTKEYLGGLFKQIKDVAEGKVR